MFEQMMTIGGAEESGDGWDEVINPATGQPFGRSARGAVRHAAYAVDAARTAFAGWAADASARRAAMLEAAKRLSAAARDIGQTLTREQGKPVAMAIAEVFSVASALRHYANQELPDEVVQDDRRGRVWIAREPLGVVAAITPGNFPVAIAGGKLAPALRAGNTVVLKPSPYTPLSTLQMVAVLASVLPAGVINVITGGPEVGRALVAHPDVDHVSFTGSVAAGRDVAAAVGHRLRGATLELGGNDAAIVLADVDPQALADTLFWDAFANCGQACNAIKRLFVPEKLHDELVELLAARAKAVKVGDGMVKGTELGPVATAAGLQRLQAMVQQARDAGAVCAAGGSAMDGPGYFHEPTILTGAGDDLDVVAEEQFGPVLPILAYADEEEAVRRANATPFGLGGSVWSARPERALELAQRLEVGTAWVNAHAALGPDQPVGGVKDSGRGMERGVLGLHELTRAQVRHLPYAEPKPAA